jgi:membrane protein
MRRFLTDLAREATALRPLEAWREILRGFERNDLLTYASAISFRVVFALIPLALLGLSLLGMFGLEDIWRDDLAPEVKGQVSAAAYKVIEQTVRHVLDAKQAFWATVGAVIAIWEVSSAMRAVMTATNRIYGATRDRSFWRRMVDSFWLAGLVTVMLLAAVGCVLAMPRVLDAGVLVSVAGWAAALVLLLTAIGAIVRFAPCVERPLHWVSFGAVLVVVGWIGSALAYSWYATSVADYGSAFGSLAAVIVTLGFVYVLSVVFLTGLQLDSLIRGAVERPDGVSRGRAPRPSGESPRRPLPAKS